MPRQSWVRSTVVAVSVALAAACSRDDMPTASQPVAAPLAAIISAPTEDALKPALELEKARIAAEQEASKRAYDSLKVIWERDKDSYNPTTATLLLCDPLQYKGEVKIIGPKGGDISVGPHKLSIPPGALSQYYVITAEAPVSLNVVVKFSPHGLVFQAPPQLMLNYKHCLRPNSFTRRVVYLAEDGTITEWPPSQDTKDAGEVYAWIGHFSGYAVAHTRR